MSKPDRTIDPRILESAKKEFLRHGYEKASLKKICDHADVTTGALYKRYKSKEDLFGAVVEPVLNELQAIAESRKLDSSKELSDIQLKNEWDMNYDLMMWWFSFLYERYDGFVLLLRCSQGTHYANFHHDWVEMLNKYTYEYYEEAKRRHLTVVEISKEEFHTLLSAFWAAIYEPFIHDFTWEQIEVHCRLVCRFFDWFQVLQFNI